MTKAEGFKGLALALASVAVATASAEVLDRPTGFRIGERMTIRPYVSASATWDSNPGGRSYGAEGDMMWTVSPAFTLDYNDENWSLKLNAFYSYHCYTESKNVNKYNSHNYGETLRWNWSNSKGAEKGWSLMLAESYRRVTMADDISLGEGRSYNGDRGQFDINGGVQRRFNENWHADLRAGYYNVDYDNDTDYSNIGTLYGWQRWTGTLLAGFAPSPWTDFLVAAGYHGYNQDNAGHDRVSRRSDGYTAQAGIGSYATERISYRALAGWSRFDYGDGASTANGFVYTLSGNWKISDTLQTMLLATSYYQPSERELSSRSRVDAISWGIAKSLVRGKLHAKLDMTYRHETHDRVSRSSGSDYDIDVTTARFGLDYTLNRFLALFAYGEYLRSWNSNSHDNSGYCDYDRWRVTGGVRLTY
ncbi:MAG: hypothetical protein IKF72_04215 [Kiritimatiellae bacterium]|nr:hypothetical protein [Kiritimatiellia bacterium]